MRKFLGMNMAAIAALLLSSGAGAQVCTGNCNGDATVAINELITCVSISLGATPLLNCEACDADHDESVAINELILSVGNSLTSCANASPTATPGTPGTPATPATPSTPSTPATPNTPSTPSTPATPATPSTPDVTGTPDDVRCCVPNDAGDEIECEDRTADECADQGGVNKGLGVCDAETCADVLPPNPDVRCCVPSGDDFECEDRNAAQCTVEGGVNRGPGDCAPDTCDDLVGSTDIQCCVPDSDGEEVDCEDRTAEECIQRGGTNMGPGDCDPDPCNP